MNLALIAALGGCASLALIAYTVLSYVQERQQARQSLRSLERYEVVDQRQQELSASLPERLSVPLMRLAAACSRRVWPPEYVAATRKRLATAGRSDPQSVERFLAVRIGGFAAVPVWALLIFGLSAMHGIKAVACFGLLSAVSAMGPNVWLSRRIAERQAAVGRTLPDILDLLTISVEAGLGFEQALDRVVRAVPGPLSEEFARMLGETRAGASRADAMRALDERTNVPELRSFVLAILQADTFGVSIGRILRSQSEEMRTKRRQLAHEKAQKAPIKMLLPMVFCIFPSLFVVVIGPAFVNIRDML